MVSATSAMTFQEWASSRLAMQKIVQTEQSFFEQIPASVLDKSLPRWELNGSGQKVLGSFTIRKELQGRCLIVFLPGSHTPTCSNHLPLLVATADKLNKLGINIIVVCVNKTDDLDAWAEKHDPAHKLKFIPDMNGELTLAAGVGAWSERLGLIANRVAIVKDEKDVVRAVLPELNADKQQSNGQCIITGRDIGEKVLALLNAGPI